jgi:hypothetical protein
VIENEAKKESGSIQAQESDDFAPLPMSSSGGIQSLKAKLQARIVTLKRGPNQLSNEAGDKDELLEERRVQRAEMRERRRRETKERIRKQREEKGKPLKHTTEQRNINTKVDAIVKC